MPLVIVALTVGAGSWLAIALQDRSFRNNELFRVRLARAAAAESTARELRRDVEEAIQIINLREEFMQQQLAKMAKIKPEQLSSLRGYYHKELLSSPGVGTLRRSVIDLNALADDSSRIAQMATVRRATDDYAHKMSAFDTCMKSNYALSRSCAVQHADIVDAIRVVVVAHGKRVDTMIQAREAAQVR